MLFHSNILYQRIRSVIISSLLWAGILCVFGTHLALADVVDNARQQMSDGHDAQAASLLESWARSHANDYEAIFMLGMVYAQQEKYGKAIEMFHQVSALRPDLAEPHSNLALIYHTMGDNRAAVKELELFLHKEPGDAIIHENLGDLHVKLALRNYKAALASDPSRLLHDKYQNLLQTDRLSDTVTSETEQVSKPAIHAEAKSTTTRIAIAETPPQLETTTEADPTVHAVAAPATFLWKAYSASSDSKNEKKIPTTLSASESRKMPVYSHTEDHHEGIQVFGDIPVDNAVLNTVEAWRLAWSMRDIPNYFSVYADHFTPFSKGKTWTLSVWKKYKERVISEKTYIHIILNHMSIAMLDHGNRARVQFQQIFDSDSYHSQGGKELMLEKEVSGWKIIRERKSEQNIAVSMVKAPTVEQTVLNTVEAWRRAWSKQDILAYFSAYAARFRPSTPQGSRKVWWTHASWQRYKKRVFSKYAHIHIILNHLSIAMLDHGNRARVRFQQTFDSDSYHSQDYKELIFIKQSKDWKIIQEREHKRDNVVSIVVQQVLEAV